MRAVLAFLLVLTSGQAFAVCRTAQLNGTWTFASAGRFCTLYTVKNGRGSGVCNHYSEDGALLGQEPIRVALLLEESCHLLGGVNGHAITGHASADVRIIVGASYGFGAFNMTR